MRRWTKRPKSWIVFPHPAGRDGPPSARPVSPCHVRSTGRIGSVWCGRRWRGKYDRQPRSATHARVQAPALSTKCFPFRSIELEGFVRALQCRPGLVRATRASRLRDLQPGGRHSLKKLRRFRTAKPRADRGTPSTLRVRHFEKTAFGFDSLEQIGHARFHCRATISLRA